MEIRTPVIALLTLTILLVVYLRKAISQITSARIFFSFLIAAYINIISEIVECAVFIYLDNSFYVLRRATQIIYCLTLLVCVYLIMCYVYSKVTSKRVISNWILLAFSVPMLVALIMLIVGEVHFARTADGYYYNYGSGVSAAYFSGFLYIYTSIVVAIAFGKRMKKDDRMVILAGLMLWVVMATYQYKNHGYQVSGVAIMLMAVLLFISIENPREFYERAIPNVLNKDAFTLMINERFNIDKSFYIIAVIFTGKTDVLSTLDRMALHEDQSRIGQMSYNKIGQPVYLFNWNTLASVVTSPAKVEEFMNLINDMDRLEDSNYRKTFCLLEAPKYTKDPGETIQILSYISGEYVYTQSSPNLVIDDAVVDKMIYRNSIEEIVRQAVKDKAFNVYYQPILNVEDGCFSSAEALVRLKRPNSENYVSPEDFIPIAEKCGLVQEIDDLVFEKVCSFIAREKLQSYGIKVIEVNLSGTEVVDPRTYDRLIHKMEKYHIPPHFINFEITETSYINNDEVFKDNVRKLKDMGSTFSMDDFGSGYSNLLEILKMDYFLVKMDKEFVWNCLDSGKPENLRMLEYTINFLKDYGLHVLAEGVENLEQARLLISKGVEYLQGFYYSKPISEEEYIEFLKAQKGMFNKGE